MLTFKIIFGLIALIPVIIPLLMAKYARNSPDGVRTALGIAGSIAGAYAVFIAVRLFLPGAADIGIMELLIGTAAISFYLSLTGVLVVAVLGYAFNGRAISTPSIAALCLLLGCLGLGIFLLFPFLIATLR
jgi:hypothetical protein